MVGVFSWQADVLQSAALSLPWSIGGCGNSVIDFLFTYSQIAATLARLLRVRFIDGNYATAGPVARALRQVIFLNNTSYYTQRNQELNRLSMLARQLKTIEAHDSDLLEVFRRMLVKGDDAEYAGCRFEVTVCATLIANKIPFVKSEAPDFTLVLPSGHAMIECTSTRLTENKTDSLTYKICSAVRKKGEKTYAIPSTSLFIDVTNVFFHMDAQERDNNIEDVLAEVQDAVFSTSLGNVILFAFLFEEGESSPDPSLFAWRIDNETIAQELLDVLDTLFPGDLSNPKVASIPSIT